MARFSEETKNLLDEMQRKFFVPLSSEDFLSGVRETVDSLEERYSPVGQAFVHNLTAVISTVSLPFSLASTGVHDRHMGRGRRCPTDKSSA